MATQYAYKGGTYKGTNGDDYFMGSNGNDTYWAYGGKDTVFGGGGVDTIYKTTGSGYAFGGGQPGDHLSFYFAPSGVGVYMNQGTAYGKDLNMTWNGFDTFSGSNNGGDYLYGFWNDNKIYGHGGKDHLVGKEGNDLLKGGSDADIIDGGKGVDKLFGGSGADHFVFQKGDSGDIYYGKADTIYDFDASDTIHIPTGLSYGGSSNAPAAGNFNVWTKDDGYVVTWRDADGWQDIHVFGDNPIDQIASDASNWFVA